MVPPGLEIGVDPRSQVALCFRPNTLGSHQGSIQLRSGVDFVFDCDSSVEWFAFECDAHSTVAVSGWVELVVAGLGRWLFWWERCFGYDDGNVTHGYVMEWGFETCLFCAAVEVVDRKESGWDDEFTELAFDLLDYGVGDDVDSSKIVEEWEEEDVCYLYALLYVDCVFGWHVRAHTLSPRCSFAEHITPGYVPANPETKVFCLADKGVC